MAPIRARAQNGTDGTGSPRSAGARRVFTQHVIGINLNKRVRASLRVLVLCSIKFLLFVGDFTRDAFTRRAVIFAAGSALLVPLLAVLLRTPDSDDLPAKIRVAGSSHTLLEHLDEALLHAPWVACARAH